MAPNGAQWKRCEVIKRSVIKSFSLKKHLAPTKKSLWFWEKFLEKENDCIIDFWRSWSCWFWLWKCSLCTQHICYIYDSETNNLRISKNAGNEHWNFWNYRKPLVSLWVKTDRFAFSIEVMKAGHSPYVMLTNPIALRLVAVLASIYRYQTKYFIKKFTFTFANKQFTCQ